MNRRQLDSGIDRGGLLLICQHPHEGNASGVVDRDVNPFIANTRGVALLAVAGDAVYDLAEAGQLLDVDVDQVAGCLALVALQRRLGLQIPQPTQPQAIKSPRQG